jgi:hypothetical protein
LATIDDIQRVQFVDLDAAQDLALRWLREELKLQASAVSLYPKAVSLNSFNGFATIDGEEVFFKSHVEPDSVITEYYNSQALHDAGYDVVLPLRTVHESGQQVAFYPRITAPVVFDLLREVEVDPTGIRSVEVADAIVAAERAECRKLLGIYKGAAEEATAEQHAVAPVHQLFWHRLTGERFRSFYEGFSLDLPAGGEVRFVDLLSCELVINGVAQPRTLGEILDEAAAILDPAQAAVVAPGHGDAHFGNVFLRDGGFLYFDPAFGGRHSPALDVVKPLFHNVFAQWMYFPEEKAEELRTTVEVSGGRVAIDYEPYIPAVREALLEVKRSELLGPLVSWLQARGGLSHGMRTVHLALACCPLLTMNLTDRSKFPAAVSWAGLAQVVQMGNWDVPQELRLTGGPTALL